MLHLGERTLLSGAQYLAEDCLSGGREQGRHFFTEEEMTPLFKRTAILQAGFHASAGSPHPECIGMR